METSRDLTSLISELKTARAARNKADKQVTKLKLQIMEQGFRLGGPDLSRIHDVMDCW